MQLIDDEQGLLDSLVRDLGDEDLRAVYADWLEERGVPRSEWLRLEAALFRTRESADDDERSDDERTAAIGELRDRLAAVEDVDPEWASLVTRVPIENCDVWSRMVRLQFRCPERWEVLAPTVTDGVRFCGACRRHVFYCPSIDAAKTHARAGNCVAVAPDVSREPGDLDDVEMMLGEMAESDEWPEGLDPNAIRPLARVFRAFQRALTPGEEPLLDHSRDDEPSDGPEALPE